MKSNFTMCFMGIIVTLYFNVAQGLDHYPQGQQMEPFPLER